MNTSFFRSSLIAAATTMVALSAPLPMVHAADPAATPASDEKTEKFSLSGMHCEPCAETISSAVKSVKGVEDVTVKFVEKEATVTYHAGQTTADAIVAKIKEAGYDAKKLAE